MRVRTALQGAEALRALGQDDVHVVVTNLQLSDVTGPDFLRAIRERDTEMPVIFVTSWPSFAPGAIAEGSSGSQRNSAEALRGSVVTAAVGYRVGQRARRRSEVPAGSPAKGE